MKKITVFTLIMYLFLGTANAQENLESASLSDTMKPFHCQYFLDNGDHLSGYYMRFTSAGAALDFYLQNEIPDGRGGFNKSSYHGNPGIVDLVCNQITEDSYRRLFERD